MAVENLGHLIGELVLDHDQLEVRIALVEHAVERSRQQRSVAVSEDDDGEELGHQPALVRERALVSASRIAFRATANEKCASMSRGPSAWRAFHSSASVRRRSTASIIASGSS